MKFYMYYKYDYNSAYKLSDLNNEAWSPRKLHEASLLVWYAYRLTENMRNISLLIIY